MSIAIQTPTHYTVISRHFSARSAHRAATKQRRRIKHLREIARESGTSNVMSLLYFDYRVKKINKGIRRWLVIEK